MEYTQKLIIKFLYGDAFSYYPEIISGAIKGGQLDCLKALLVQSGISGVTNHLMDFCKLAVKNNHCKVIPLIQWIHLIYRGFPPDNEAYNEFSSRYSFSKAILDSADNTIFNRNRIMHAAGLYKTANFIIICRYSILRFLADLYVKGYQCRLPKDAWKEIMCFSLGISDNQVEPLQKEIIRIMRPRLFSAHLSTLLKMEETVEMRAQIG